MPELCDTVTGEEGTQLKITLQYRAMEVLALVGGEQSGSHFSTACWGAFLEGLEEGQWQGMVTSGPQ